MNSSAGATMVQLLSVIRPSILGGIEVLWVSSFRWAKAGVLHTSNINSKILNMPQN
jgi:hypothetical protein